MTKQRNLTVKSHLFLPSRKKIWTVVGNNEYWLDVHLKYCSCRYFYYKSLMNAKMCSHLEKITKAIEQNEYEEVEFSDQNYDMFVTSLLKDILNSNF
ncbi:MAG: hypothetical protein DA328_01910 [Nitrososphaeraceae archaeon]|nr:hypothetical protein [Nitrososphaeraceae archaeon]